MFEQAKLIFKIQNRKIKTNVDLTLNKEYNNYNLRTRERIRNIYARTKKGQNSPVSRSIQTYNTVPLILLEEEENIVLHNLKKDFKDTD